MQDLLDQGMREDYDHEPEHSMVTQGSITKADASPSHKAEVLALTLDTSSQVSVKGTEASVESDAIHASPMAVAHGSQSDSPSMDLFKLQTDANLAIMHMLSIERSSDLQMQQAIRNLETVLCQ